MLHFLDYAELNVPILRELFAIADNIAAYENALARKTLVLFFPSTSLRTRVTFEKGIAALGGQALLFPPEVLDKKEALRDVTGYLANWADGLIIRHNSLPLLRELAAHSPIPVVNAMTSENHPCEILADLYALSKRRADFLQLQYTFVGHAGNIGRSWLAASRALGFRFRQCCPLGCEIPGAEIMRSLDDAVRGSDVVLTDSLPPELLDDYKPYKITLAAMQMANAGAMLNPCPPFYRGEEVSAAVMDSPFFVGYAFKESLLAVQQAVLIHLLTSKGENTPCLQP